MASDIKINFVGNTRSFDRANKKVRGGLSKLGGAAVRGGAAIGAAAVVAGAASLKMFAEFDDAMTASTAIMGDLSENEMKSLEDAARQVGKTTRFSAKDAADGLFFLASAGMDAEQAMAALPGVAEFATAGNFDLATATDLLTDAQSAMGLTVDDAQKNLLNQTRVADVFVKANTLANTSVEQISQAMTNKAGPAAKAMGISVEDATAVLAAMADQGIKGAKAGTSYTAVMNGLTKGARKNEDAFADYGISVFDAQGNMKDMSSIIGDMEGAFDGMSVKQKEAALEQLGFTKLGKDGVNALMGSSDAIEEYATKLKGAGGVTKEVSDKQLSSFSAQMELLGAKAQDLGLTIGKKMAPMILKAIKKIEQFWKKNGDQIMAHLKVFAAVAMDAFNAVVEVIQGLIEWIIENKATWQAMIESVIGFIESLIPVFQDIYSNISIIVEQLIDFILWVWEKFGSQIMEVVMVAFGYVKKYIKSVLKIVQGVFKVFAGLLSGDWGKMWDGIKQIVSGVLDQIKNILSTAWKLIKIAVGIAWKAVQMLIRTLFNAVVSFISDRISFIVGFFKKLPGRIKGAFGAGFQFLKNLFDTVKTAIQQNVIKVIGFFKDLPGNVKNAFGAGFQFLKDMFQGVKDFIFGLIEKIVEKIKGIPGLITDAISSIPGAGVVGDVIGSFPGLADGAIVNGPQFAMIGEAGPEVVIPLSPGKAGRREQLMDQAGLSGNDGGIHVENINIDNGGDIGSLLDEFKWIERTRGVA